MSRGASDCFGPGCAEVALPREYEYMEPGSSAVVAQGNQECRKVGEGLCPVTRCSQALSSPAAETKKKQKEKARRPLARYLQAETLTVGFLTKRMTANQERCAVSVNIATNNFSH